MKAWLLTKEYQNKKEDKGIIMILNSRMSNNQIEDLVRRSYPNLLSVEDAISFAKSPNDIPYKITHKKEMGNVCLYDMTCGQNVCIRAVLVNDIKKEGDFLVFKEPGNIKRGDFKIKGCVISRPKRYLKEYSRIKISNTLLVNN